MSVFSYAIRKVRSAWSDHQHEAQKRDFEGGSRVPADTCLLVADHGIGDHYIVGAFAASVRRHYRVKIWLAGSARLSFISTLFPAVERYLAWPTGLRRDAFGETALAGGRIFYAHFPALGIASVVGYGNFHFLDAYRVRLGLPENAPFSLARPPDDKELAAARAKLTQAALPVRSTVLICPDARSIATGVADLAFFLRVARMLKERGFSPVFNGAIPRGDNIGFPTISVPLPELRAFVCAAGGICSLRSGISDLVADLPCRQVVVFSNTFFWGGRPLHRGTTLTRQGLEKPPFEIVVCSSDGAAEAAAIALEFSNMP